jgi:predicted RecA/RadA family phage recombinase
MTTKFQEVGEVKNWTNDSGGAVVTGQVVAMGALLGVAITNIASNAVGAVKITGVFNNMPKVAGTAWTVGKTLFWDVSTGKFDVGAGAATGDVTGVAVAWEAALSGDTVGTVAFFPTGASTIHA